MAAHHCFRHMRRSSSGNRDGRHIHAGSSWTELHLQSQQVSQALDSACCIHGPTPKSNVLELASAYPYVGCMLLLWCQSSDCLQYCKQRDQGQARQAWVMQGISLMSLKNRAAHSSRFVSAFCAICLFCSVSMCFVVAVQYVHECDCAMIQCYFSMPSWPHS